MVARQARSLERRDLEQGSVCDGSPGVVWPPESKTRVLQERACPLWPGSCRWGGLPTLLPEGAWLPGSHGARSCGLQWLLLLCWRPGAQNQFVGAQIKVCGRPHRAPSRGWGTIGSLPPLSSGGLRAPWPVAVLLFLAAGL